VDDGQTIAEPVTEQGGGGLTVTPSEQVLFVVYGPLLTVSVTLTV